MMLWEKSVGESRVDCSRVSCSIKEGASTRRLEVIKDEGVEYRQTNGVCETEHTDRNESQ